ncbi:hypothetical protein PPACK8108_LOCUS19414 [Phakopsora pachyrhizi]|uniref:Uncharacterized protein n=1 Tax=Phakopsora pachyrhizi TaxID=170000 RepID=A0AAV0BDS4_PHAPC|nr:hypothetical protein PPACK8108_LOCUS19414 [Phakopsora pachyrhizi]
MMKYQDSPSVLLDGLLDLTWNLMGNSGKTTKLMKMIANTKLGKAQKAMTDENFWMWSSAVTREFVPFAMTNTIYRALTSACKNEPDDATSNAQLVLPSLQMGFNSTWALVAEGPMDDGIGGGMDGADGGIGQCNGWCSWVDCYFRHWWMKYEDCGSGWRLLIAWSKLYYTTHRGLVSKGTSEEKGGRTESYLQEIAQNIPTGYPGARYVVRDTGDQIDLRYNMRADTF